MKVIVRPLHRDAAHGDVLAVVLAALGEHDAERPGRDLGVLQEQLVEITHPVEQQAIRVPGLDAEILRHHGRHGRRRRHRYGNGRVLGVRRGR